MIEKLRAQGYTGPIFLSSNVGSSAGSGAPSDTGSEYDVSAFTETIPKQPMSFSVLRKLINPH